MKKIRLLFSAWSVFVAATANAQYTFAPQVQSTSSAGITYNSGTGVFQYTDADNATLDFAYLPLAGTVGKVITISNAWTASLTVNISATSMTAMADESPQVGMDLGVICTNGGNVYLARISLGQVNNSGSADNTDYTNGFYGTGTAFVVKKNDDVNLVTTPAAGSYLYQGDSSLVFSGGLTNSAETELLAAVTGTETLSYNPNTKIATGYYNGTPVGSYSLANFGSNPPLALIVIGGSGEGIGVGAGAITASNFVAGAVPGIASFTLSGTNLVLNATNGLGGAAYHVLMSTNAALPLNQWTPVATNVPGANGNFSITVTNTVTPSAPRRFYTLETQ